MSVTQLTQLLGNALTQARVMPKPEIAKSPDAAKYDEVANLLRETREALRLSQQPLSKQMGKHKNFMQNAEASLRRVDVVEFYRLAKAFGIDPVEFYAAFVRRIESK